MQRNVKDLYPATNEAMHLEFQYDGAGNLDAYAWIGDTKPGTPQYSSAGTADDGIWGSTGTVNAFGTANVDWATGNAMDATVDNMYLVPEPATLALLGIGGLGVLIRRRRHV